MEEKANQSRKSYDQQSEEMKILEQKSQIYTEPKLLLLNSVLNFEEPKDTDIQHVHKELC